MCDESNMPYIGNEAAMPRPTRRLHSVIVARFLLGAVVSVFTCGSLVSRFRSHLLRSEALPELLAANAGQAVVSEYFYEMSMIFSLVWTTSRRRGGSACR